MHITLETDYAIRIVDCLAKHPGKRMGAQAISDFSCVTLRFSLKILRKLVVGGIVRSYKGAQGGYELELPLEQISLGDIIETIEGPYMFNRCLNEDHECTRMSNKAECPYHNMFSTISHSVRDQLREIKMSGIMEQRS